jgi:hypothetical protein
MAPKEVPGDQDNRQLTTLWENMVARYDKNKRWFLATRMGNELNRPRSRWPFLLIALGTSIGALIIFFTTGLHSEQIKDHQSWIQQIIDTHFIIALIQLAVGGGILFVLASVVAAVIAGRPLETFFGGAKIDAWEAEVTRLKKELNEANQEIEKGNRLAADYKRDKKTYERTKKQLATYIRDSVVQDDKTDD